MKKLLSLPPNLVGCFHEIEKADRDEWFCCADPVDRKLGSGGGTAWLLEQCMQHEQATDFNAWLAREKRILLHAGGQSRRLPGYAPSGKILTPIPVYRWGRGQRLTQNLLSLQLPLYEQILRKAPEHLHTMIVSGDILVRTDQTLPAVPDADVVVYGLWVDASLAKNHGVFVMRKDAPDRLDCMLQKPSVETLGNLMQQAYYLMDIGVWLLSDRAVEVLRKRATGTEGVTYYDLYGTFGLALGQHPTLTDDEVNALRVAVLPLPGGQFYHYGTSRELISSTVAVQNLVHDQREITHHKVKPHTEMFTQNAHIEVTLRADNAQLWIENSFIGKQWYLHDRHVLTGIPVNDWQINLPSGICVDVVPVGESDFVVRPYGFADLFKGAVTDVRTVWMERPIVEWLAERHLDVREIAGGDDLQSARLFPQFGSVAEMGKALRWMLDTTCEPDGRLLWQQARKWSADELSAGANLRRLTQQRESFRNENWLALARNYQRSVFYQLNLNEAAEAFAQARLSLPEVLPEEAPLLTRVHDAMFRAAYYEQSGQTDKAEEWEERAFARMRTGLLQRPSVQASPRLSVYPDQIVWARCPVRIDLAGGWTDTPPYCLHQGGNVINLAITLNGQPPLQVYIKPCTTKHIILRSIDMGASEVVTTYDELQAFNRVGSPFSIPKAALALAGFHPDFCAEKYNSLVQQLEAFGAGIEITLLAAIPAGSGLGTSSILASTMLGAINDFCALGWDKQEIGNRTLVLEQLLTTGGGWQDQFGGILPGIKLLQTERGWQQMPLVRWLPQQLFVAPEYKSCHLLYYTGLTRTAKGILGEIVKRMFLNETAQLDLLRQMKQHALDMYEAIQRNRYEDMARLVGTTWQQNQRLDAGTNPSVVQAIISQVADLCYGYKLPGAGGGGYLYMAAKDAEAAARIRKILREQPVNAKARLVEMQLSDKGLEVSRN